MAPVGETRPAPAPSTQALLTRPMAACDGVSAPRTAAFALPRKRRKSFETMSIGEKHRTQGEGHGLRGAATSPLYGLGGGELAGAAPLARDRSENRERGRLSVWRLKYGSMCWIFGPQTALYNYVYCRCRVNLPHQAHVASREPSGRHLLPPNAHVLLLRQMRMY